jgi:hypothetical protein
MWNKYDMTPSLAINAPLLIAIESGNSQAKGERRHCSARKQYFSPPSWNIHHKHHGLLQTRYSECSPVNGLGRSTMRL